jgi:hypothetical protein
VQYSDAVLCHEVTATCCYCIAVMLQYVVAVVLHVFCFLDRINIMSCVTNTSFLLLPSCAHIISVFFFSVGGGVSSLSGEESDDEPSSEEESDDEPSSDEDENMPPPPPKKNTSSDVSCNKVTHVRFYSEEYKNHYYTLVDDPDGESDWVPPPTGVIQCTDETSGKIFYTESATGKTAWDLNGF